MSLNEYCARKLTTPGSNVSGPATAALEKAVATVAGDLVGLMAFGSWARREAGPSSDVDMLVVVEDEVALRRELYRAWDATPLTWDIHRVEPHFVHLPDPGARVSGLWAEAAVDGLVLFERELELSRRLATIRRRIVAGELVRRETPGGAYWVEAA